MSYIKDVVKIYGPYKRKSDGREVVRLKLKDGSFKMKSYARYLTEVLLGRDLDRDMETVDHIVRDQQNNLPENLQILTRKENSAKSVRRIEDVFSNCVWCGKIFKLSKSQIKNRSNNKAGPFCSKSCSGKYGSDIQNFRISKLEAKEIQVKFYRNDDK